MDIAGALQSVIDEFKKIHSLQYGTILLLLVILMVLLFRRK